MLAGKYAELYHQLKKQIPEDRLLHDDLNTLAFGADASFYRLTPKLVVKIYNEDEALFAIRSCAALKIPFTVRAAGTSLSGQAISDSVLLVIEPTEWRYYSINEDAALVTVQPALIGGKINQYLQPYKKKIGPDPASINAAFIGGIVANNASGMSSGVQKNSYHTLAGLRLILSDGTLLDTRDPESRRNFLASKKEMVNKLSELRQKVLQHPEWVEKIKKKYRLKNTTGYGLNALIDFEDPIDIIEHLMVGSEGTLAFISEITLKTVDDFSQKATSLIIFPDIETACKAIAPLRTCRVAAAELMDRASLRSVENKPLMPAYLKKLDEKATALLVETRANDEQTLNRQIAEITAALKDVPKVRPVQFTTDVKEITALWSVRKGLFPSVCANRPKGTTVVIEDIAVPYENLARAILDLQALFQKYRYDEAIIWGHAFDGNVHFVLIQDFTQPAEVERYANFMDELVRLVVEEYDGSLKAEHGTGRNMAPFVKLEWGEELYQVMREIKQLFDPQNIVNPGVLINDDPQLHLKSLKPMPRAHDLIDDCIECGFCENSCVSRSLTLSPRQRIVVYREMQSLKRSGEAPQRLAILNEKYNYHGNETCATDGLCALTCPVNIDTGKLIKELRHDQLSPLARWTAQKIASHMGSVTALVRFGLGALNIARKVLGNRLLVNGSHFLRAITFKKFPRISPYMPLPAPKISRSSHNGKKMPRQVVYFPSCITRSMGVLPDSEQAEPLTQVTFKLLQKAGFEVILPENVNGLCCGMAFSSKGFFEVGRQKAIELEAALLKASNNGQIPVLSDMSPCLYTMKENLDSRLKLFEPIAFSLKYLAPHLRFTPLDETITVFPVCSAKKMELEDALLQLARMCAKEVVVPETNCCGFAGDRGFNVPELNASGLKLLKEQLPPEVTHGYSTSRTCEIGLSEHGGLTFESILYLVDRVTQPK
ncbi:FAD linked oxidase domain protein [Caldithrix abyssi DSM 13497]|uniref:D-lactate dehydrogenase (cytochrome) n=1 Tax=Caldithrix abyssi DSM 13497 TaxID=880073 RepID=H1XNI3_CALAY|nr:FAD-binding and (Fe-S)-binding domain-containing protein [Caldithrix abyssi]APF18121.1 D-lactate dehydrogenase [Caldithrix abyssi DSM 13497]EHO42154.1 FAD linked oxidase domain protein [Caldithrix abyssi DSM 13497]